MAAMIELALGTRCECEYVATVAAARKKLVDGDYQLLICDVNADGEPSLALVSLVAAAHPDIAVLLITDEDDPAVAERAFALGAHGYLLEPIQPGQLLIATMNALRRRELELVTRANSRRLQAQVQQILDMAPMAINVKSPNGQYIVSNATADELIGVERGKVVGATDLTLMSATNAERAAETDRLVLEAGPGFKAEEILEPSASGRVLKVVKFPLFDEGGAIVAVGGISTDITAETESIRLRDELSLAQSEAIDSLRTSRQEAVERLTRAIDRHDPSTGAHILRMAGIVGLLATLLDLDPNEVDLLRAAAPMHDVGKIATRLDILRKPGDLTDEERSEMEEHTLVGQEILAGSKGLLLQFAASIALTHHEHYDGTGYPLGLTGEEIPLAGRIVAVADVFDALLSDRSYRPAMTVAETVALMRAGRDSHFDPRIVDLLVEHLDEALTLRLAVVLD